jgi:hypothetical protein
VCPDRDHEYHGYNGLIVIDSCAPCICGAPVGKCELPSALTAHDVLCQDLGQPHNDIPFDAPTAWDGGCNDMSPIDAGTGVKSLSIGSLTVKEGCKVGSPVAALNIPVHHYWQSFALGCYGQEWSTCGDTIYSTCVRDDAPSPEFKLCISRDGDDDGVACPDDWPDRHVFYAKEVDNLPQCTECTCEPVGSMCEAFISVYTDNACQAMPDTNNVTSSPDFCINVMPSGQALGSKSAGHATYHPGVCQPMGGELVSGDGGPPVLNYPVTWCCKE